MANIAAKVREEKDAHPERFCADPRCLWRVVTSRGPNPCQKHPHLQQQSEPAAATVEGVVCYDCHEPLETGEVDRCAECAKTFRPAVPRSAVAPEIDTDELVRATLDGAVGDSSMTSRGEALAAAEFQMIRRVDRPLTAHERTRIALAVTREWDRRHPLAPAPCSAARNDRTPRPVPFYSSDFAEQFTRWYCDGGPTPTWAPGPQRGGAR